MPIPFKLERSFLGLSRAQPKPTRWITGYAGWCIGCPLSSSGFVTKPDSLLMKSAALSPMITQGAMVLRDAYVLQDGLPFQGKPVA